MYFMLALALVAHQVECFKPTETVLPYGSLPDEGPDFEDSVTLTVYTTLDSFTTVTNKFLNSIPITITEFTKSTVTLPTREVVRTNVDNIVRVTTLQVTRPATETVTDVFSMHKCTTEVSTEFATVTHLDQRFLQKTITLTTFTTITFNPTIVQTVISTEREVSTETETITNTVWIGNAEKKKFSKFIKYQ